VSVSDGCAVVVFVGAFQYSDISARTTLVTTSAAMIPVLFDKRDRGTRCAASGVSRGVSSALCVMSESRRAGSMPVTWVAGVVSWKIFGSAGGSLTNMTCFRNSGDSSYS